MDDLISRQAVLDEIETVCFSKVWSKFRADNGSNGTRDYLINYIKQLPSVQPVQKEIKAVDVIDYCRQKNLVVISKELFDEIWTPLPEPYQLIKEDKE